MRLLISILFALSIVSCASKPEAPAEPEWTRQPTRLVDNGYIVYVGVGESSTPERAQVMAEGQALEDLANECSLIPKGTRIEDRYSQNSKRDSKTFVKVAVEFQECDSAMRTNDPTEIKKVANVSFTQQLKRYQDLNETGELEAKNDVGEIQPPDEFSPAPQRGAGWNDSTHFYVTRQYVAYQKEIVVMSPPTAYAAGSVESRKFVSAVQPSAEQMQSTQISQPALRTQAWSRVPDHPRIERPAALKSAAALSPPNRGLRVPSDGHEGNKPAPKSGKKARRLKRGERRA